MWRSKYDPKLIYKLSNVLFLSRAEMVSFIGVVMVKPEIHLKLNFLMKMFSDSVIFWIGEMT